MVRKLFMGIALAVLMAGCAGEEQKSDETAVTAATDGEVSSSAVIFDPMGSDSGDIEGLYTVNFEFDKSSLTAEARQKLTQNAEWIQNQENVNIQIEGHCDERGTVEYNLALGQRRADAVRDYLVSLGVDANRLSVLSYGEEKPLATGSNESAWAQNRRANFVPLPQ